MNKKIYLTTLIAFLMSCLLYAAGEVKTGKNSGEKAGTEIKTSVSPAAKYDTGSTFKMVYVDLPENRIILTAGGGYFMALGAMGDVLDPSWAVKLSVRIDNLKGTLFGLGADIWYTRLPDAEYSDGSVTYSTTLPYVSATFPIPDIINIQFKAGAGLSTLVSKVHGESDSSVSLTLGFSGGFFQVFAEHYAVGAEFQYNYYFQMHTSDSAAAFLYAGYSF